MSGNVPLQTKLFKIRSKESKSICTFSKNNIDKDG